MQSAELTLSWNQPASEDLMSSSGPLSSRDGAGGATMHAMDFCTRVVAEVWQGWGGLDQPNLGTSWADSSLLSETRT